MYTHVVLSSSINEETCASLFIYSGSLVYDSYEVYILITTNYLSSYFSSMPGRHPSRHPGRHPYRVHLLNVHTLYSIPKNRHTPRYASSNKLII